jgi:hypothetical protein
MAFQTNVSTLSNPLSESSGWTAVDRRVTQGLLHAEGCWYVPSSSGSGINVAWYWPYGFPPVQPCPSTPVPFAPCPPSASTRPPRTAAAPCARWPLLPSSTPAVAAGKPSEPAACVCDVGGWVGGHGASKQIIVVWNGVQMLPPVGLKNFPLRCCCL